MSVKRLLSSIILLVLASVIAIKVNDCVKIFIIPDFKNIREYAEGLITVSTILMGFAFTVMGLLYTFDASKFIQKMKSTDYVVKRARTILFCLCILGVSSMGSICLMVLNLSGFYKYIYIFSVLSLVLGIICFIISTYSVYKLIYYVHAYDKLQTQEKYAKYLKKKHQRESENEEIEVEEEDTW